MRRIGITAVGCAVSAPGPQKQAAAIVSFTNLDEPRQLAVFLVETPRGWRINDIVGRGGQSLRALYKLK